MKFALSLIVVAAVVLCASAHELTDAQKVKNDAYEKTCTTEIGVTEEAVKKLQSGDYSSKDEKVKCFTKCVMQKAGFLNDKGELQEKVIVDKLSVGGDREKVTAMVAKCKSTKSTNPCENAYVMHECYKKAHAF